MAATYEPIATTTLSSAASSITFSSIASSWTDLRLVFVMPSASGNGSDVYIRYNNDSGSNYSMTSIDGDGSSATSGRGTNTTQIYANFQMAYTSTTLPMFITTDIFSYAGSTYKTALTTASADHNGGTNASVSRSVSLWRSTSAINRLDIFVSGITFASGTTATLYGIKAA